MIVGLLVGVIGFQFIFEKINLGRTGVIQNLQQRTRTLKHKNLIQYASMLIIGGILIRLMATSHLGNIPQGIIVGMIWAMIMFTFEDTMFDRARNTLR